MLDDKTPHYSLPLPHADNLLEDDVDRLRSALIELDAQLDAARLARSTLAESLTSLTGAQSGLGGDLSALLNSLNSHAATPASTSSPGHAKPGTGLSADAAGALSVAYGATAGTACQGNDPRLSADRAPIAHATSHKTGGSDPLKASDFGGLDASSIAGLEAYRLSCIGAPHHLSSTTLPAGYMWADGSLALFADWPELHAKYASNGFAGMVLPYNASSYDKQNYPAKFVPNAANPSGLYLPRLGGLFSRYWTPGQGNAGQYNAPGVPNITGRLSANRLGIYEVGNNQCTGPFSREPNYLTNGQLGAGVAPEFIANSFYFYASYSNSIYGASSTVMPPSANVPVAVYLGAHA